MKYPVVSTFDYTMYIEPHDGLLFFHTDIHRWNKTVRNDFLDDFNTLIKDFPTLYAVPYEADNKMVKFGTLLGFEVIEEAVCDDGVKRKIFMLKEKQ